ncbi:hypothetical protein DFH09DRAFT_1085527 [Mycena vulgaris]|nr:hypothetical protein DFH09DRAFT_1085527 [Mycena vulgaris]
MWMDAPKWYKLINGSSRQVIKRAGAPKAKYWELPHGNRARWELPVDIIVGAPMGNIHWAGSSQQLGGSTRRNMWWVLPPDPTGRSHAVVREHPIASSGSSRQGILGEPMRQNSFKCLLQRGLKNYVQGGFWNSQITRTKVKVNIQLGGNVSMRGQLFGAQSREGYEPVE